MRARLGRLYGKLGRICTAREFRKFVRNTKPILIDKNPNNFGIPQGTPLSGLYANISMIHFDDFMQNFIGSLNGSYRRYSDDIAILVPIDTDSDIIMKTLDHQLGMINLKISEKKTEISVFKKSGNDIISDRAFQYLGFTYDGSRVLIRNSSLNRYYAKMHSGTRAKVRAAKKKGIDRDFIFLRQLYQRYTHFGKSKNFPRYAYRAAKKFGSDNIRRQISRHMFIFKRGIKYYLDKAF